MFLDEIKRQFGKPGFGLAVHDSIEMLRAILHDEEACRLFLETARWSEGRYCPKCGSLESWPIRGKSARPGLYECKHCHRQFTVTTGTPMHGTKLPLWRWIQVMYLMCWSSKGVSSVVMGRWTGLPQSTAWTLMQKCRELMNSYTPRPVALSGTVEVDEKFLGGAPRFKHGVKHKRGKGTKKPRVLIALNRDGFVRAAHVRGSSVNDINWFFALYVDRRSRLMSDTDSTYQVIGRQYASHEVVQHGQRQYVEGDVHCNGAEAFGSYLERTLVGVYHFMSRGHLQRYVGEAVYRWNAKTYAMSPDGEPTNVLVRIPPVGQICELLTQAGGVQLRRTTTGGLRYPDEEDRAEPKSWARWVRWAQRVGGEPLDRLIDIMVGDHPPPPSYYRVRKRSTRKSPPSWLSTPQKRMFVGFAERPGP